MASYLDYSNSKKRETNKICIFAHQLCQLLSLTLENRYTVDTIGSEKHEELNARIEEIDLLLTNNRNHGLQEHHPTQQHGEEHVTGRQRLPTEEEPTRQQDQRRILALTHLQSLVEWMISDPSFYVLVHLTVINSDGGKADPFFVLLKSLFSLSAGLIYEAEEPTSISDDPQQQQQQAKHHQPSHRLLSRRSTSLKQLLAEWRRLSKEGKRQPGPILGRRRGKTLTRSDEEVNRVAVDDERTQQHDVGHAGTCMQHHETSTVVESGGISTLELLESRREILTELEVESSADALLTSSSLLFHLFCISLLPVILWSYLTRCVYPSTLNHQHCDEPTPATPEDTSSLFVEDDILGLESILTAALGFYSSLLSLNCRATLPILDACCGTVSICSSTLTRKAENETIPRIESPRDTTSYSYELDSRDSTLDFEAIINAKHDVRVVEASKGKETNPYLESAMNAVTTPLLLTPGRQQQQQQGSTLLRPLVSIDGQTSNQQQQQQSRQLPGYQNHHHSSSFCQLVAGCRETNVPGSFLPYVQWTERLRSYLTLQILRLVRFELLPLLQCITEFESPGGLSQQQQQPRRSNSQFPGMLLCFSCLHQLIVSVVSFNFQPIDTFRPTLLYESRTTCEPHSARHSSLHSDYRFPVDEELVVETFRILVGLQSHFSLSKFPNRPPEIPNVPSGQIQSMCRSLSYSSFQRSLDLCLLRSQYEILPRAVLMILSFRNVIRKTKS